MPTSTSSMRSRLFSLSFFLAPLLLVPFSGGCVLLHAPAPMPTPTPLPPLPEIVYDVTEGTTVVNVTDPTYATSKGKQINSADNPALPFTFHATVVTPDTLILQPMYKGPDEKLIPGTADVNNPVRLAGIVVPTKGTVGYEEAMLAVQNWAVGRPGQPPQNLDVYIDPKYPNETEYAKSGKPLRLVQVFFQGDTGDGRIGPTVDADGRKIPSKLSKIVLGPVSLNRWIVRAGWANVDLYSPTSFDQKTWLYDETFARQHNYGLWKYGVTLQQRLPESAYHAPGVSVVTVSPPDGSTIPQKGVIPKVAGTPRPTPVPRGKTIVAESGANGSSQTSLLPPPVKDAAPPAGGATDGSSSTSNSLAPGPMATSPGP